MIGVGGGSGIPVGAITQFGGSTAPIGWLLCDGAAVSQTTYASLFATIGTTYGAPGGGNFNLPDLRSNVPVGYKSGDSDFGTLGGKGGEKTHTLSTAELASHAHQQQFSSGSTVNPAGVGTTGALIPAMGNVASSTYNNGGGALSPHNTVSAGSGTAHNNLQPYIVVNYIIKH